MKQAHNRLDQLTFLRFLAALWVFAFHAWPELSQSSLYQMWVRKGHLGVSFFFVLSGFVLTLSQSHKLGTLTEIRNFWKARAVRILPAYWVAVLLTLLYQGFTQQPIAPPNALVVNLLALQAFFFPFDPAYLAVFPLGWSITVELFFYALFPWLIQQLTNRRIGPILIILWLVTIWLTSQPYEGAFWHELYHHFPLVHLNQLLWGILAARLYLNTPLGTTSPWRWSVAGLLGIILVLKFAPAYPGEWAWLPYKINLDTGLIAPFFGLILLGLSRDLGPISHLLKQPLLVYLGEISYSFYLLQEVSMGLFQLAFAKSWIPYPIYAVIIFLINLGLSILVYHAIEKPALRGWRDILNKNAAVKFPNS